MRRLLLFLIFFLLIVTSAFGRGHIQGTATYSQVVTTVGTNSSNKFSRVLASATITVYSPTGTTNLATLYSNAGGLSKANPFTAGSDGSYSFYTDASPTVDIRFSGVSGVSAFTISDVPVLAGDTSSTLLCGGTNDTTLLSVASALGGTIVIPNGITCASNSQTLSAALNIQKGGLLKPITGQTVMLTGPQLAGPWQTFTNATAGLGTASFSGNASIMQFWAAWWGASPAATATINAAAFNAANQAVITVRSGEILIGPGSYLFNSTFNLGDDAVAFTGVSLRGTNGLVGTTLIWMGSTSGTAIYCTRARTSHLYDIGISSGVARGASIGVRISGPALGTNNSGVVMERMAINNFSTGLLIGDGTSGGHDASEIMLNDMYITTNDTGIRIDGSNTLNVHLYSSNVDSNSTYGIDLANGGAVSVYGGAWGRNAIGFNLRTDQSLLIQGVRDEMTENSQFVVAGSSGITSQVTLVGCDLTSQDIDTPLLTGIANFTLIGNAFGSPGFATLVVQPNSGSGKGASVTMIGNQLNENGSLMFTDPNSVGASYTFINNIKRTNGGSANGKWDDESGTVDGSGNRVVLSKFVWGASSATRSLAFLTQLSVVEGTALTIGSNTIAPTRPQHQVGAGLIKTITVPSGFASGTIALIPTAAFTYDATGNILGTGTATIGRTMFATYSSSTSKWSMSY